MLDALATQGAGAGMVFRVEAIGLLDNSLTSTQHLLKLEPCRWDAE